MHGGLRAVANTDIFHGVLLILFFFMAVIALVAAAGGLTTARPGRSESGFPKRPEGTSLTH
jgi:hypothetical protein